MNNLEATPEPIEPQKATPPLPPTADPSDWPPSIPATAIELPWTIGAGFSAVTPQEQEAHHEWRRQHQEVIAKYPVLGSSDSRAYAKFLDLYAVYHGSPVDLMALADLVMIYPPVEQPAE